ncbi:MAG: FTR1 family protein [Alphaproteobacteria bacterium]|nr:FTR1 family protein [Alphaproteobacteria bacterium]
MIPAFIILFREILEISIILSIVMAATHGVAGRGKFVWLGIAGGLAGSALVALFAGEITDAMEGMGQEIFNGTVLLLAAAMIAWTTIWMQTHGRVLSQKIKKVGADVMEGSLPLTSVAAVVALSMWREGAEIALFMTGIISTTEESLIAVLGGALAGGLVAATVGALIYFGLIKLSSKHLFVVTGWMLMLLASGMAAAGAGYLAAADVLPVLVPQLWDSSAILSQDALLGKILHAMLGYSERPSGIQLAFYVGTLTMILTALRLVKMQQPAMALRKKPALIGLSIAAVIAAILASQQAHAAFEVRSPYVEEGMLEIETKNRVDFDSRSSEDGFRQHVIGVGYGFTSWWGAELEGEWEKEPNDGYRYKATEVENTFQFTDQGEYFVDVGAKASYEFSHPPGAADKLEAVLLLEKTFGRTAHTINLGVEKEVGDNRSESTEGNVSYKLEYAYLPYFNPGFEYYSDVGELKHTGNFSDQKHRFGPALYGKALGIKYDLGWLFGLSKAAEDHVFKLNLEYEFPI